MVLYFLKNQTFKVNFLNKKHKIKNFKQNLKFKVIIMDLVPMNIQSKNVSTYQFNGGIEPHLYLQLVV